MTEKELIAKIRILRQIKPAENWVFLTKKAILGESPKFNPFPQFWALKPALAGFFVLFLIFGAFVIAKNSLPGDLIYPLKKMVEKGRSIFVSQEEEPAFNLQLANERLEDLTKASAKNLAPTINEFQANLSQAAQKIKGINASSSDPVLIKKIVAESKKLEENRQKVESLGVVVEGKATAELEDALASVAGNLISDLEERTLSQEKEELLTQMEELFQAKKYSEVLEIYLINQ